MKKGFIISSSIGVALLIVAQVFKLNHWPGAAAMLLIGAFIGVVGLVLSFTFNDISDQGMIPKITELLIVLSAIVSTLGFTFKLLHYPGGNILVYITILLFLLALIMVIINNFSGGENKLNVSKVVMAFVFLIPVLIFMSRGLIIKLFE
jgi:hypothetical protein